MLPLLPLPLSDAKDEEAEEERLMAQLQALREKRQHRDKRQRREAPTIEKPLRGRVVSLNDDSSEFAVRGDFDSTLWWFPNVATVTGYRSIRGPKMFVKTRDNPDDGVQITTLATPNYIVGDEEDPATLIFKVGTAVTFVPYELSELLFDEDGRLVMRMTQDGRVGRYSVTMPKDCAGVATEIAKVKIGERPPSPSSNYTRWTFKGEE